MNRHIKIHVYDFFKRIDISKHMYKIFSDVSNTIVSSQLGYLNYYIK